jgi:hypothetical protein
LCIFTFTYLTLSNGDLVKHSPVYSERPPQSREQGMLASRRPWPTRRGGGPCGPWQAAHSALPDRSGAALAATSSTAPRPSPRGRSPSATRRARPATSGLPQPPLPATRTMRPTDLQASRARPNRVPWRGGRTPSGSDDDGLAGLVVVPMCLRATLPPVCAAVAASPRLPHAAWGPTCPAVMLRPPHCGRSGSGRGRKDR